jgi:hypothetical protein
MLLLAYRFCDSEYDTVQFPCSVAGGCGEQERQERKKTFLFFEADSLKSMTRSREYGFFPETIK